MMGHPCVWTGHYWRGRNEGLRFTFLKALQQKKWDEARESMSNASVHHRAVKKNSKVKKWCYHYYWWERTRKHLLINQQQHKLRLSHLKILIYQINLVLIFPNAPNNLHNSNNYLHTECTRSITLTCMKISIKSSPLNHCPSLTAQFLPVQCCMEGLKPLEGLNYLAFPSLHTSASSLTQLMKQTSDFLQALHHFQSFHAHALSSCTFSISTSKTLCCCGCKFTTARPKRRAQWICTVW